VKRCLLCLIVTVLFAARVSAQTPTFEAASSAGDNNAASLTFEHIISPASADRYLACGVATQSTTKTVTSATFNGVALTLLTTKDNSDDPARQSRVEYWYLIAPPAVTGNVVVTMNSATAVSAGCVSYTGVDQGSPHGTPVTAKGDSNTVSVAVVADSALDVVLDATSIRTGTTTITAGAGQTERVEEQSAAGVGNTTLGMSSEAAAVPPASTTMTWAVDDATSKAWTTITVALHGSAIIPPSGNTITVCASGCTYNNSQLQTAMNTAACGDQILLEAGMTYSRSGSFVMGDRCSTGTFDRITIRTGVGSTGTILNTSLFPTAGMRISVPTIACPTCGYRTVLAKLIPAVNNEPAIRTIWPAEIGAGCSAAPCLGNGWTLKWLEFGPKADWMKGRLILFGSNKAASDSDLPNGDAQNTIAEVPDYLTLTQCDVHGDPYAGQHGGIYLSSQNTRVTLNAFTDIKSLSETQAITEINGVGPFLIENNLVQATGENIMFGGGDSKLQQTTTITGSPSSSSIVLNATSELFDQEFITVTHLGIEYSGVICTLTGSTCALAPTLPITPSAGDVVKWTRMAGGATIRLNAFTKPLEWRDPIIAAPTSVSTVASLTGGTLAAGTYYYRVAGRRFMGADGDAESAAAAEVSCVIASGSTGSCRINFTESPANTGGTFIFGRATGAQTMRWSVADGVAFYIDTGTTGVADAPRATGDTWVVKNAFELKHLDGGAPAGPNLIEGNVIGPSWCCSQSMIVSLKVWNQSGGDVSSTVRNVTFRKNWIRHGVRGINLTTAHAEFLSSGYMADVLIENNLFTDLSTTWGGSYTPIQISGGNYANHVGSRGGSRITFSHNTFLADTAMDGPMWFVMNLGTDENDEFVFSNNLAGRQGSLALRTYISDNGQTAGTTSWNLATSGFSYATNNVWPDASSGTYTFSASSFFPTNATLQSALVNYSTCFADVITGCALNGSSAYDSAGSDGLDIGADIAAIQVLTDVALSGNATGGVVTPGRSRLRLRIRIGG